MFKQLFTNRTYIPENWINGIIKSFTTLCIYLLNKENEIVLSSLKIHGLEFIEAKVHDLFAHNLLFLETQSESWFESQLPIFSDIITLLQS